MNGSYLFSPDFTEVIDDPLEGCLDIAPIGTMYLSYFLVNNLKNTVAYKKILDLENERKISFNKFSIRQKEWVKLVEIPKEIQAWLLINQH